MTLGRRPQRFTCIARPAAQKPAKGEPSQRCPSRYSRADASAAIASA